MAVTAAGMTTATLVSLSANFNLVTATSSGDVGNPVTLYGSTTTNSQTVFISAVISPTTIIVTQPTAVPLVVEGPDIAWELRSLTQIGDGTQVSIAAPPMIQFLAGNFGLTIDTQESDARQRSWVKNVTQWMPIKGWYQSYEIIGDISGFDITVSAFFRISLDLSKGIPSADLYEIGESAPGRSGGDGTIVLGPSSTIQFSSPTAAFKASDVGLDLQLSNVSLNTAGLSTLL